MARVLGCLLYVATHTFGHVLWALRNARHCCLTVSWYHANSVLAAVWSMSACPCVPLLWPQVIEGAKTSSAVTLLLRGANDYMLDEMDRSLHDSLCVVKRVLESGSVVPGERVIDW